MADTRHFPPRRDAFAGLLVLFALMFSLPAAARQADTLAPWREEVDRIRLLAENDAPRAYREALLLQATLPGSAPTADRVRMLNLLARIEVYLAQTDAAARDTAIALHLAQREGDRIGEAEAHLSIILNSINQGRLNAAANATVKALALLDGTDRPDLIGEAMLRTAMMYLRSEQFEDSVTIAMQAQDIAQRIGTPMVLTYAHQGMALSYHQSGKDQEARDEYAKMRIQARTAGSKRLEAHGLLGQASMTASLGDFARAEAMANEAIALFRATGIPYYVSHALFGLADIQRKQKRHTAALALLDEVAAIYARHPNKIGLWWTLNTRSGDHLALGHLAAAQTDAERAQVLAKQIGAPLYLGESARQLAAIAAARGDHQRAYALALEANTLAKQINKERASARVIEITLRYQNESRQRRIDELTRHNEQQANQQRWLWTVLAAAALLLALGGGFQLRLRRAHRRQGALNIQVLQTSRKLQATLNAIPDLLFEIDLDGRIHDYHSPRVDLLPKPPDQMLGHTLQELLPAEIAEVCMAALREANESGTSTGKQFARTLRDGPIWFELSVARKHDAADRPPRFIVLARDITRRMDAEQEIRLLQRAINQSSDAMFVKDMRTNRFVSVNDAACRSLGYSRDELLGMTVLDIDPDITAEAIAHAHEALEFGKPHMLETRHRSKDGRIFPVEITGAFFEDNGVPYAIALVRNITARKRIENTLRFIADPSGERNFLIALARHLGEALGAAYVAIDRLADDPRIAETVALYANGDIVPNMRYALADTPCDKVAGKRTCYYPSGVRELFPKDVLLADMGVDSYAGVPLWDSTGQPIGLIAVMDDTPMTDEAAVTQLLQMVAPRVAAELERVRNDAQLLASEQAFRALVELSPDNIARYDRECRRIYLNPATLKNFACPPGEVLGKTQLEISPFLDPQRFSAQLRHVLDSGAEVADELPYRPPTGEIRWVHVRFVPELGQDGTVASVLAVGRDITALKQTESRLQESYAQLQELAARRESVREEERRRIAREIHDELGQQLSALRLRVGVLDFQYRQAVPGLRDATGTLLGMVDKTIQVARNVSTALRPAVIDMGVAPALEWLATEFSRHAGIPCEVATPPAAARLGDEQATVLFRIVQESLTNIARHAQARRVRIALTREDDDYALTIADDGAGFDAAGPRKLKSFGLVGMRERALSVGGEVAIASQPGQGTTVKVRIPVRAEGAPS